MVLYYSSYGHGFNVSLLVFCCCCDCTSRYRLSSTFPRSSVSKESTCNAGDPSSIPGLGRFPGEGDSPSVSEEYFTPVFLSFPCGSAGKESACSAGDLGSIPGLGRSPGEGKGYPLQYSGLKNSVDYRVHGIAKSQT